MMFVRLEIDDSGLPDRIEEAAMIAMHFSQLTDMDVKFTFHNVECSVGLFEDWKPCVDRYKSYCLEHPDEFPR